MTIPNTPLFYDMYFTEKSGKLAADGYLYNDQLFQSLNLVVNLLNSLATSVISTQNGVTIANNGITVPQFTTAEITALVPSAVIGTIWFNTNLAKLQVLTAAATVETITST